MDWSDHSKIVKLREKVQDDERDMRERCREQAHFLKDRDGQWEQSIIQKMGSRPRYQFDRTTIIINTIAGEIEQNEFSGRVVAKGERAGGDIAETYDGLLRSIHNLSNADTIFKDAGRRIVGYGFDAWCIVNDWADVDAFEQDLLIRPIPDALNRVWLDCTLDAERENTRYGFIDAVFTSKDDYHETFPDGTGQTLGAGRESNVYDRDALEIITSDCYYIKHQQREIHLLSDGRVVDDEEYQKVAAGLAIRGVTIEKSRKRKIPVCYMRTFDGHDWLSEEKRTPFSYIPIIGVYGNFDVIENKRVYFGETEKLMDPQRVYNYARSREIEEGALAPRRKIMMTPAQAKGHENQLKTLNTNADPVQFYNPDTQAQPPYETMGPVINPALAQTSQTAALDLQEISGSFNPGVGKPVSGHSGVAYELLQNKTDTGNNHYMEALKRAIAHTGKIIVDAIPKVYDTAGRQIRMLGEDGSIEFKSINEEGPKGIMRDLSQGHYDFTVTTGPSFKNRKTEGLNAMLELLKVDPTILQDGKDVLINSMDAPYIDKLAERIRAQMIKEGRIPESQLTDDERDKIMQEMQNQQPDPMDQLTQELIKTEIQQALVKMQTEMMKAIDDRIAKRAKAIKDIEDAQAISKQSVMDMMTGINQLNSPTATSAE